MAVYQVAISLKVSLFSQGVRAMIFLGVSLEECSVLESPVFLPFQPLDASPAYIFEFLGLDSFEASSSHCTANGLC